MNAIISSLLECVYVNRDFVVESVIVGMMLFSESVVVALVGARPPLPLTVSDSCVRKLLSSSQLTRVH